MYETMHRPKKQLHAPVTHGVDHPGWHFYLTDTGKEVKKLRPQNKKKLKRRMKGLQTRCAEGKLDIEGMNRSPAATNGHLLHGHTCKPRQKICSKATFVRNGRNSGMKKTMKMLCGFLACALALGLFAGAPTTAGALDMQSGMPGTITLGTASDSPTVIAFAGREWIVVGYNGSGIYSTAGTGAATLLLKSKSVGTGYGGHAFRAAGGSNEYSGSDLQSRMVQIGNVFSANERGLINPRNLTDGIAGSGVNGQLLWPLSVDEATSLNSDNIRVFGLDVNDSERHWWLRSPGSIDDSAAVVFPNGSVDSGGDNVDLDSAIRPAFSLNLSSVLFTSAASGMIDTKSYAALGGALVGTTAPTGAVKLTVEYPYHESNNPNGQDLTVIATTAQSTQSDTALAFSYSDATTGTNQFVSCVLTQGSGASEAVKYYGKLADTCIEASGPLSIPLTGIDDGTYTLKIFSEQANGENYTDFCSTPITATVVVSDVTGSVSYFGGTVIASTDATIKTVEGQTITAGSEAGTAAAPKTASVSMDNSVSSLGWDSFGPNDENATVVLGTDVNALGTDDIPLSVGSNTVYVKVTAEDETTELYYELTITRAAPNHDPIDPPTDPIDPAADAVFAFAGDYADMGDIRLNGTLLTQDSQGGHMDLSGYPGYAPVLGKAEPGSVKVTLYKEFLRTLPNGVHSLTVAFGDGGEGELDFEVKHPARKDGNDDDDSGSADTTPPTIRSVKATPYGKTGATLEVAATDASTPLRYQWQVEGSWIDIPGATTATFDYTGLTEGKSYTVRVRVTDAAGNTATSNPVTFAAGATAITGLPDAYALLEGRRVSWAPSPTGGTWQYDSEYLTMTESGGQATFTAQKVGKTVATYTVNGTSHAVQITINHPEVPQTGDRNDPLPFVLLALASLAGLGAMLLCRRKRRA